MLPIKLSYSKTGQIGVRYFNKACTYKPNFAVSNAPETSHTKLANDIRVYSENWGTPTCTVGLWINIGARCETDNTRGATKFLEHMYFKGTANRDHKRIQSEVLQRGASLGTYTSRETVAIYANCLSKDVDWAVNLLGEIVSAPKYTQDEFEKEKFKVLQEISHKELDCKNTVYDYLHASAFQGTPLANSVIGSEEVIKHMTLDDLYTYHSTFYKAPRMVLVGVGDFSHNVLQESAEKHLKGVNCNYTNGIDEILPSRWTGSEIRDRDDAYPLGYCAIGFEGPPVWDEDTLALNLATQIIGKYDKTMGGSRFQAPFYVSRATGLKDLNSFESFYFRYQTTSMWGIYFAAERENLLETYSQLKTVFWRTATLLTEAEVDRARNQLLTNLMLDLDSNNQIANQIGQDVIWYGRRIPINELITRYNNIRSSQVRDVLLKYVYRRDPVAASFGAIEGYPLHTILRESTNWFML